MRRLKIAVYTMAKNEAAHVQQYAATTQGADAVVVTDTGSTDGTPDLLRDQGITVHNASILPWRFDTATNCALCNVPADIDVCVKLDLDEVLYMPDGMSWREEIERLWQLDTIQLRYWYTWSWHVRGKVPSNKFVTQNIHARVGCIWRHPGHASLCTYGPPDRHKMVMSDKLEIHHYQTSKSRPDYTKLLSLAVVENRCPRTLFYLGRQHFTDKRYKQGIEVLTEYLQHPQANWRAERADAMRMIGISCEALGDANQSMSWLMRAHGELSNVRELWFAVLRLFCNIGDFAGGYWAGTKCLSLQHNEAWNGHETAAWFDMPHIYMAKCAWHTGKHDAAVDFLKKAIEINPNSQAAKELALTIGIPL